MSENIPPPLSIPVARYIGNALNIGVANRLNGQRLDELFGELAAKAENYRNRWLTSEAKIDAMKDLIAKQHQQIRRLHEKLDKMSKKNEFNELAAQDYANKYHDILVKLKTVILESAAENEAGNNGK